MNQRQERVSQLLQKELTDILRVKVRDERVKKATITKVLMSPDLKLAKVYYVLHETSESETPQTTKVLNRAKGFLKAELASRVELRYLPDITFYYDDSLEYREHMDDLFRKIKQ